MTLWCCVQCLLTVDLSTSSHRNPVLTPSMFRLTALYVIDSILMSVSYCSWFCLPCFECSFMPHISPGHRHCKNWLFTFIYTVVQKTMPITFSNNYNICWSLLTTFGTVDLQVVFYLDVGDWWAWFFIVIVYYWTYRCTDAFYCVRFSFLSTGLSDCLGRKVYVRAAQRKWLELSVLNMVDI